MELLPDEAVAPPLQADPRPVPVSDHPHLPGDLLVGGHRPEDLRRGHRALRVQVCLVKPDFRLGPGTESKG